MQTRAQKLSIAFCITLLSVYMGFSSPMLHAENLTNPHETILKVITPLITKSKQAGENGLIYPDQMPNPPFVWNHHCDDKIIKQLIAKRLIPIFATLCIGN